MVRLWNDRRPRSGGFVCLLLAPLALVALVTVPCLAAGPYTADANTVFLYHFDNAAGATTTPNAGSAGGSAIAFDGDPIANPAMVDNSILGASGLPGFGAAANFSTTDKAIGYDANGNSQIDTDPDSTDDFIAMSELVGADGAFTLEAMVNFPGELNVTRQIFSTDKTANPRGIFFRVDSGGDLRFRSISDMPGGVEAPVPTAGPNAYAKNVWYHAAYVYDGNGTASLYWTKVSPNATEANLLGTFTVDDTGAAIPDITGDVTGPLAIGNDQRAESVESLRGLLDEARISNVARAATDFIFPLTTPIAEPILTVSRDTGAVTLMNAGTAPLDLRGYSITSEYGALDADQTDNWKPISGNYDAGAGGNGDVDSDDAWTILTAEGGNYDLSEYQFGGTPGNGGSIGMGESVTLSLAGGAWIPTPIEDLEITLVLAGAQDGQQVGVPILYEDNGGQSLIRSDLNHDGGISVADWVILRDHGLTDLSALSPAQAYSKGDLDGDNDNDIDDYTTFVSDYDDFNGAGAFAAMLQGVPEPSSLLLCGLGGLALISRRNRRRTRQPLIDDNSRRREAGLQRESQQRSSQEDMFNSRIFSILFFGFIAAAVSLISAVAEAQTFVLDPFTDGARTDGADPQDIAWYTHNADTTLSVVDDSAGIGSGNALNVDNTNNHDRIVAGFSDVTLGSDVGDQLILEFDVRITDSSGSAGGLASGFRFGLYHENGTPTTADDQGNDVDGDDKGYRMMIGVGAGTPRTFLQVEDGGGDAILSGSDRQTLYNSVSGANSAHIGDSNAHTLSMVLTRVVDGVTIDGFLDGVSVFDEPAFDDDDNQSPYEQSGDLLLPVINTFNEVAFGDSASSGTVTDFILDNVRVRIPEKLLTALVQPVTGEVLLINSSSDPVEFDSYQLTSSTIDTLNPAGWNSLSDQNLDPVGGGDDDGETWDEVGGSGATALAEQFLLGSTTLAPGETVSLGAAYDTSAGGEFTLRLRDAANGTTEIGGVETILLGDMDGNGMLEEADVNPFVQALTDRAGYEAANPDALDADVVGDFDGNGQLDLGDVGDFRGAIAALGAATATASVPEPSTGLLALFALSLSAGFGRRRTRPSMVSMD